MMGKASTPVFREDDSDFLLSSCETSIHPRVMMCVLVRRQPSVAAFVSATFSMLVLANFVAFPVYFLLFPIKLFLW